MSRIKLPPSEQRLRPAGLRTIEKDMDFEAEMHRLGTRPLAAKPDTKPGRSRSDNASSLAAHGRSPDDRSAPAATTPEAPLGPDLNTLLRGAATELRRVEAALLEAQARAAKAEGEVAALRQSSDLRLTEVLQRGAALQGRLTEMEARALQAEGAARMAAAECEAALALAAEAHAAVPAPIRIERLDHLLERTRRGTPAADFGALVAALAGRDQLGDLLERVQLIVTSELAHYLDDRVAWLCPTCRREKYPPQVTLVTVAPAECERCGGSSIQAAAQRFHDAARAARVGRVLIVGGSPRYHETLRKLEGDLGVQLRLVRGDVARDKQRAQSDLAGADMAFLWASTLLDHKVSELYAGPKVHMLPVRGVGRMLDEAARRLAGPG